ncbi:MAG: TetR/AcrR family transcriptional regulator [Thioalkalivibrio sp.]|nr:TetR/AcrR family transcriptional regulator [Thioalkalivibrio sp.]
MTTDRRRQILNEATSLFARRGFVGTSIRQIARKCGITEAAIYRHFPGKLRLYEEVIRAKSAEHDITGYLADKRGCGSILDALIAVSSHIMTLTREDPGLMRLMFNNAFESGDVSTVLFQEIRQPYIDFLGNEFEERMRSGEIIRIEALLTGRCFVGMVMDCALNLGTWDALYPSRGEPFEIHTNTAKIFATGLLARNRALPSQDSPDQRRTT